jgi:hypothetical protein
MFGNSTVKNSVILLTNTLTQPCPHLAFSKYTIIENRSLFDRGVFGCLDSMMTCAPVQPLVERNRLCKMSNLVIYADESGTHEGSAHSFLAGRMADARMLSRRTGHGRGSSLARAVGRSGGADQRALPGGAGVLAEFLSPVFEAGQNGVRAATGAHFMNRRKPLTPASAPRACCR